MTGFHPFHSAMNQPQDILPFPQNNLPNIEIQFGYLYEVLGRPAREGSFVFMPVLADIEQEPNFSDDARHRALRPPFSLLDHLEQHGNAPTILDKAVDSWGGSIDAAWVRARIPMVFHFTPLLLYQQRSYLPLLNQVFVACQLAGKYRDWVAYPFVCTDIALQAGLKFSRLGPEPSIQEKIAASFWQLLLSNPDDVMPFRDCCPDGWVEVKAEADQVTFEVDNGGYGG